MSRLPIRARVTLAFAAALLVVLLAVGSFVYLRFADELRSTVDRGLAARSAEVVALRAAGGTLARSRAGDDADEDFALVLERTGRVLDATPAAPPPRLSPAELARARTGSVYADRPHGARDGEPARLLVRPLGDELVVTGTAVDDQRDALRTLLALGGLGLLAALALGSAAGYWAAGLALRPVEAMRREANAIGERSDRRLPLPAVDDELGRLGRTLNEMLERLDRARAAEAEAAAKERRFVADASHELRTPLAIMQSELDVTLQEPRSAGELRAALASLRAEVDRLVRLSEDLLVLARADEGGLPLRREPVDVPALLDDIAGRHADVSAAAPTGLVVAADPARLRQALGNLVDNALRHGRAPVELRAEERDGSVRIGVRDSGPGFPPEFADHAFERFARPAGGRAGGTGLGLAIVAAIAAAHGGTATVAPGATEVVIELPSSSAHREPSGSVRSEQERSGR
jgi:signal transduction histidine kinase